MLSRIKKIINTYKELKYLAYHDSLTGLYNRNWLYKNIDTLGTGLGIKYVYFIDINDLHKINKKGHTIGDEHIKEVVRKIKLKISNGSLFIRYAGDEFIILSNTLEHIETNNLYAVGLYRLSTNIQEGNMYDNLTDCIIRADKNMIESKKYWKKQNK